MSDELKKEETSKKVDVVATEEKLKELKEETPVKSTNSLQVATTNLPNNYGEVAHAANNLDKMMQLAEVYVKGKMCPLKTPEDVVIAITTGQQLGLPFMTSINYIHPINGKPAMSTHLHRAILLKNHIFFTKLDNYEPMYTYYEDDGTNTGNAKKIKATKEGKVIEVPVSIGNFTLRTAPKGAVKGRKEVDRITTYLFEREVRTPSGKWKTLKVESSFTMREAVTAELLSNPPWVKYPARMLDARSFGIGSKEIAADVLLGMPSISEMAEVSGINYEVNEDYQETVIVE